MNDAEVGLCGIAIPVWVAGSAKQGFLLLVLEQLLPILLKIFLISVPDQFWNSVHAFGQCRVRVATLNDRVIAIFFRICLFDDTDPPFLRIC